MNVKAREAHAVAARGIVLIGRPGIVRQHAEQGAAVRLGDVCEQLRAVKPARASGKQSE